MVIAFRFALIVVGFDFEKVSYVPFKCLAQFTPRWDLPATANCKWILMFLFFRSAVLKESEKRKVQKEKKVLFAFICFRSFGKFWVNYHEKKRNFAGRLRNSKESRTAARTELERITWASLAPSTLKAYEDAWRQWQLFCSFAWRGGREQGGWAW